MDELKNKPTNLEEEVVETKSTTPEEKETFKEMSPMMLILRRFFRSKLSLVGLVMIIFLFLFSFLGPVVYQKWGETTQDFTEVVKQIPLDYTVYDDAGNEIKITQVLEHSSPLNSLANPSKDHLLGTDADGYDVFVRLMYGGRISLTIGFIVVILETIIGVILGGLAGYFGGWVDQIIMRVVDIFNCIPTLPILLIAFAEYL